MHQSRQSLGRKRRSFLLVLKEFDTVQTRTRREGFQQRIQHRIVVGQSKVSEIQCLQRRMVPEGRGIQRPAQKGYKAKAQPGELVGVGQRLAQFRQGHPDGPNLQFGQQRHVSHGVQDLDDLPRGQEAHKVAFQQDVGHRRVLPQAFQEIVEQ